LKFKDQVFHVFKGVAAYNGTIISFKFERQYFGSKGVYLNKEIAENMD